MSWGVLRVNLQHRHHKCFLTFYFFTTVIRINGSIISTSTIYSVNANGIDQDGTFFPVDKKHDNDTGYRLWNPDNRRANHSLEIKKVLEDSSK